MGKALMIMLGAKPPAEMARGESEYGERKKLAAEDLLSAIKKNDAEAVAEALTAIFNTCQLEE